MYIGTGLFIIRPYTFLYYFSLDVFVSIIADLTPEVVSALIAFTMVLILQVIRESYQEDYNQVS